MLRVSVAFSLLLLCFNAAEAGVTQIDTQISSSSPHAWKYVAIVPQDTKFGEQNPFVSIDYRIESERTTIETSMILYHYDKKQFIGQQSSLCCTQEMFTSGDCDRPGELILQSRDSLGFSSALSDKFLVDTDMKVYLWPTLRPYHIKNVEGGSIVHMEEYIEFKSTGPWYLLTLFCARPNVTEHVTGTIIAKNPFGFLSGNLFANVPVYLTLVSSYFGLMSVWIGFVIYYRRDLMGLQHYITATVFIAFAETMLWTLYFTYYNYQGQILVGANMVGALLDATKVSTLRTLLLLVAIGYSITRPVLSSRTLGCVCVVTIAYFVAEASSEYIYIAKSIGLEVPEILDYLTLSALSSLNVIYIVWIAYALNVNMVFLRSKQQTRKLGLYRVFSTALLVFVSLSVLCFILQIGFGWVGYSDSLWSFWWVWDAYWQFSYLLLTLLIAFLWRPNSNNKRYAFAIQVPVQEEEELSGDVQLAGPTPRDDRDAQDLSDDDDGDDSHDGFDSDQLEQLAL